MTREEKEKAINALKVSVPMYAITQEKFIDYRQTLNKVMDWLEQEPVLDREKDIDLLSDIVKAEAQELFERIDEAFKGREEARKVLYSGDGFADGHMVYDMAQCPACGKTFEEDYSGWLDPYCSHCGQKLDWGFEEIEEEGSDE